jgi:hypothetical protein
MNQIHAIDPSSFARPPVLPNPGAAPLLQWIEIGDLMVDRSYQREIRGKGKVNVRKIAADFRWSCFAPVIVSPVPGGKFAIVDGQHRTTAAALIGLTSVPCQVIVVTPAEQALAFKEINGSTTIMSRQAIHAAAVVAGDPDALALEDVAARSEVKILRYPVATSQQDTGGQTMAVGCLEDCLRQYGRDTLVTALQCVTQTDNNVAGILVSGVIKALCALLHDNIAWRDSGSRLLSAFDEIDIEQLLEQSRLQAKPKGTSTAMALGARLKAALLPFMAPALIELKKSARSAA